MGSAVGLFEIVGTHVGSEDGKMEALGLTEGMVDKDGKNDKLGLLEGMKEEDATSVTP